MTNYIQPGNNITVPAPVGGVTSGQLVVIGSLIGVASTTQAAGVNVEIATSGVFDLPAKPTDEVAVGDLLYWDAANSYLTKTAGTGSKPLVGVAVSAKAAAVTIVRCKLGVHGITGPAA
jgi:predicted RecA/RadA family phage recombinase